MNDKVTQSLIRDSEVSLVLLNLNEVTVDETYTVLQQVMTASKKIHLYQIWGQYGTVRTI